MSAMTHTSDAARVKETPSHGVAPSILEHPRRDTWFLPASLVSELTLNPIRAIVDKIEMPKNLSMPLIPLSIGDPTIFGNLDVPDTLVDAVIRNVKSKQFNGYGPSVGTVTARQAIAQRYSYTGTSDGHDTVLTPNDVLITSGCSGALSIVIEAIANAGDNILIPRPGFPLYRTICGRNQIETRYYDLQEEREWECDLHSMEREIDERTRAILINNPSNPCGSSWSKSHILSILALAERYHLPIIADEVYSDMVFDGYNYHAFASLSRSVPVLAVGGIAKQFVCPGYRLGWICVYDKGVDLTALRNGMNALSQLIIGANTLIQSCLPSLLHDTPASYHRDLMAKLQSSAQYTATAINGIAGLSCQPPQGAMYVMMMIDHSQFDDSVSNDRTFSQQLLSEENVFVLPGSCFQAEHCVRLVVCAPVDVLKVAASRIQSFCERHRRKYADKEEQKDSTDD